MSRQFAQFRVSMWTNADFLALSRDLQHAYMTFVSQPNVTLCGVLDYIPGRLVRLAPDWTVSELERCVKELDSERFLVVDWDTQEVLIRSFIRHDGILASPNVSQGMATAFGVVMSETLRSTIVDELVALWREDPDMKGWKGIEKGNPALFENVTRNRSKNPSHNGSDNGSPKF